MKKLITILMILILCLSLFSCGSNTVSGDITTYTNASESVSIDLPGKWTVDEESASDTLDVVYSNGAAEVRLQFLSKGQISYMADDLAGYTDYSMINVLGDMMSDAEFSDTDIAVPDFIRNSSAQSFTLKNGDDAVKGFVVFMESSRCYYTCLAMAVDEVYNASEDKLVESVLSIREITDIPEETESEEN